MLPNYFGEKKFSLKLKDLLKQNFAPSAIHNRPSKMIINCVSLLHCGIYTKLSFSPALDFHLRDSKEFMTWYI